MVNSKHTRNGVVTYVGIELSAISPPEKLDIPNNINPDVSGALSELMQVYECSRFLLIEMLNDEVIIIRVSLAYILRGNTDLFE